MEREESCRGGLVGSTCLQEFRRESVNGKLSSHGSETWKHPLILVKIYGDGRDEDATAEKEMTLASGFAANHSRDSPPPRVHTGEATIISRDRKSLNNTIYYRQEQQARQ